MIRLQDWRMTWDMGLGRNPARPPGEGFPSMSASLLSGQASTKLDSQRRLVVPSSFRNGLLRGPSEPPVDLKAGYERFGCLSLQRREAWERSISRRRQSAFDLESEDDFLIEVSRFEDTKVDRQWRVRIPAQLCDLIELQKNCVVTVVGFLEQVLIWNPVHWEEFRSRTPHLPPGHSRGAGYAGGEEGG